MLNIFKKEFPKRKLALLACGSLMMAMGFSGCGEETTVRNPADTNVAVTKPAGKVLKIGVVWEGKGSVADKTFEGFEKGMKKLSPDSVLDIKKELKDVDAVAKQVKEWETQKDAVVIMRSNGVQWLGKNQIKIPAFFGACNHPDSLGLKDATSRKVTGSSYYLPKKDQLDTFKMILPKIESVGLLVDKTNASSVTDIKETEEVCKSMNIKFVDLSVSSKDEAIKAAEDNAGKVSAFIIGTQAKIYDNAKDIIEKAGTTPVFAYQASAVNAGAVSGFAADDVKLGDMIATSLVDTLINGKSFADVPVKYDNAPKLMINKKAAEKLSIKIDDKIMASAKVVE